ncbi:MAG: VWA domain-containing protein [Cyclobacteriaceae bacterium]|nr:VWA domain-containing protein [Cyclobacteriaceae bacterium]
MPEVSNWFSFSWFYPSTFQNFTWEYNFFLMFLLAIPVLYILRWLFNIRLKQKLTIALPEGKIKSDFISILRIIPDILFAMMIALLIVVLARPQTSNEKVEQWTEGIDIMLVVDISRSMTIQDFRPNRLEAAKKVAKNFIAGRFQDRIGIVIFSGDAYSLAPLTTDYKLLNSYIDEINFDKIEASGTAIGSALAVATNRMRESDSKSKVIILLSDGDNTAGNIDLITAAEISYAYDIKIYTIGIGKEGKVPTGKNVFGQTVYSLNTLDETTLRRIAEIGEGHFYRASDNRALEDVFKLIDRYEKAEIKENRFKDTTDYYQVYLKWAILIFLIWIALKSTFISNILKD